MPLEEMIGRIRARYIIAAAAVVYLLSITPHITVGGDDARYILMSRDFAARGFLNTIVSPCFEMRFYSLFPLLLMPLSAGAPGNFLLMKAVPWLASCASLVAMNAFFRGLVGDGLRKMLLILCAFNPWMVEYSTLLLTDVMFMFFFLFALRRMQISAEEGRRFYLLPVVVSTGCALYTRPLGIALFLGFMAFLVWRKKWKDAFFFAVAVTGLSILILYNISGFIGGMLTQTFMREYYYSSQVSLHSLFVLPYRMLYRLAVYTGNYLPDLLLRPFVSSLEPRLPSGAVNPVFMLKFIIGMAISAAIVRGLVRTIRGAVQPLHLCFVVYAVLCLMPPVYVARYLLPVMPLLLLFFFEGIRQNQPRAHLAGIVTAAVFPVLCAACLIGSSQEIIRARTGYLPPVERSFIECNGWIKAHTPAGTVILSRKPFYTRLITGREAVGFSFMDNPQEQMLRIEREKVDFVILGDVGCFLRSGEFLEKMIAAYPRKFELVFTTVGKPRSYVYKVLR